MKTITRNMLMLVMLILPAMTFAQDDLLDLLNEVEEPTTDYTIATFKGNRIVNGHSIETVGSGQLNLNIAHRFGRLNSGAYNIFGLDQANMRIGFTYGITDWLNVGVGRSNIKKTYDGFLKIKMLRQSTGKKNIPFSVVWASGTAVNTLHWANPDRINYFSSRMSYFHQLLIARKFNEYLSFQVMPTMVHHNLVPDPETPNDVFVAGVGGRVKITQGLALNVEYYHPLNLQEGSTTKPSLSLGFDIETGGHVFQLFFSNSLAMTESMFITETTGEWSAGDIHFGFNLNRSFSVRKKR